ncbi:hypothetical protein BKI52_08925 [marine bacterium AO1-C]|nr:hypothetical protein BKI52_08925 [marine bacterium AO1-C]
MKKLYVILMWMLLVTTVQANDLTKDFVTGTPKVQSMSQLTFGPQGVLFVGDSKSSTVFAIQVEDGKKSENDQRFSLRNVEGKIASLLGAKASDILIHDMVVSPQQNVYLAVSRGRGKVKTYNLWPNYIDDANVLLKVTPDGKMEAVSLQNVKYSQIALPNPVAADKKDRRGRSLRADVITDLSYANGMVYVAGLSNEEFASTFRKIPFPFKNKVSASTLEIYHGAHGRYETKSPIRAFVPYNLNGKPHILASYTCTPLVTIPEAKIENGKHVKGRTIAELGAGNMPLDMIVVNKNGQDYILMANTTRNVMKIAIKDIETTKANLSTRTKVRYGSEGVNYVSVPRLVQQMAVFNSKYILMLMRMPDGSLSLSSMPIRRI